jgi:hypothetical protein
MIEYFTNKNNRKFVITRIINLIIIMLYHKKENSTKMCTYKFRRDKCIYIRKLKAINQVYINQCNQI